MTSNRVLGRMSLKFFKGYKARTLNEAVDILYSTPTAFTGYGVRGPRSADKCDDHT